MGQEHKKDPRRLRRRQQEGLEPHHGFKGSSPYSRASDPRFVRATHGYDGPSEAPAADDPQRFEPQSPADTADTPGSHAVSWSAYPEPESYTPEELERIAEAEQHEAYEALYTNQGKSSYLTNDAELDPAIQRYLRQLTGQAAAFEAAEIKEATKLSEPQSKFIQAYISNGGLTHSALATAGATRIMYQQWLQQEHFKTALEEATERWFEELRKAAFLRAQAKSDVLLIFLLKALKPETYDDDVRKATWMAKNGLLGQENLPVRATLVRDNTFNVQINQAGPSGPMGPEAEPPGPESFSTRELPDGLSSRSRSDGNRERSVSMSSVSKSQEAAEFQAVADITGSNVSPVTARQVGADSLAPRTRAGQGAEGPEGSEGPEETFDLDDL